ncbi:MAG: dephospho-CoA kinase [Marinilabiliaceae bacterium]
MHKIGVTGGIGSGKSTVCKIFEVLGIPVYYADDRARALILSDPRIRKGYIELFGEKVYQNGQLNRKLVADRIFSDRALLEKVNRLVHPVVREDFIQWAVRQDAPYVIEEAAVLLESGGHDLLDFVVVVSAPESLRIQRVAHRDGISEQRIQERIKNQWTDQQRRELADYEVLADDRHLVVPQVLQIHTELKKLWGF